MRTFNKALPGGRGLAPSLLKRAPSVQLDWDVRQKSRFDAHTEAGEHIGVFLSRGTVLRGGDVLVDTHGGLLRVEAAAQAVLRITPCPQHGSAFDLVRAAYHLGNRHVPIELTPTHLHIEPDHVLEAMLDAMHLIVTPTEAPFEPESGAYGDGHSHTHHGGHHHNHDGHAHQEHVHAHDESAS